MDTMDTMTTARFFAFDPSIGAVRFVELTTEDPTISVSHHEDTDEGYRAQAITWTLVEDDGPAYVICEWADEGRDCDGFIARYGEDHCLVSELMTEVPYLYNPTTDDGTGYTKETAPYLLPDWQEGERVHHDQYAEAAGY